MKGPSRFAVSLALVGIIACSDVPAGIHSASPPGTPARALAGLRANADLVAGTLTFEPLRTTAPLRHSRDGLIRPAIYGDQGVTVRIYNAPVTITNPSSPGKKTFSAPVGIRNLLAFPIGDEQTGATPTDTMGIYVFVSSGPTVTGTSSACSPTCTVTVLNEHGTLAFSAPAQPYWHWNERLGAAGGGNDTTRTRSAWTFEADSQVTAFQFEVLVSAAWPPPHETRWKIDYQGDSLPHTASEPRWRITTPVGGIFVATNGVLTITTDPPAAVEFYRSDSVTSAANAYAEARVQFNSTNAGRRAAIHFSDGVKYVALGISPGTVGFVSSAQNAPFIASWATTTNTFRTYQLRKYASDSAVIYVDGVRVGAITYANLSADPAASGTRVSFGSPRTGGSSSADWDYVVYEIGSPQP